MLLIVFLVVRGVDGYGNLHLHRFDEEPLRWLQVSKYPTSIAFISLTLGVGGLLLAWFVARPPRAPWGPVTALGQRALFFYVIHVHALEAARAALGVRWPEYARTGMFHQGPRDLETGWIAWAVAWLVLWPACLWRTSSRRKG